MSYTLRDLFLKGKDGTLTKEERAFYTTHFMSDEEEKLGKPLFEMNYEEELAYKCLCYNNEKGKLTDYDCPICKNKGDIMIVKGGNTYYPDCSCMTIRQCIANMRNSGLGELLNKKKFSNYEVSSEWQREVFTKAKNFIESESKGFLFCGTSGSGKTHICTAISNALLRRGIPLRYMIWVSEAPTIKGLVKDSEKYLTLIHKIENVQALYIDDLLKTKEDKRTGHKAEPTEADVRLAFEIINYRYNLSMTSNKRYITIISTEWTVKQINDIDSAMCGRLCEMAGKDFILSAFGEEKNYRMKSLIRAKE